MSSDLRDVVRVFCREVEQAVELAARDKPERGGQHVGTGPLNSFYRADPSVLVALRRFALVMRSELDGAETDARIANAARKIVSDCGFCDNIGVDADGSCAEASCCDDDGCAYCRLVRSVDFGGTGE